MKKKFNNLDKFITSNANISLELDAHALILLMCNCNNRNTMEQFLVLFFSSQPNEQFFGELRTMTTTNETVINFTMKELGEKIRRAMMKMKITYRRQNELEFPILKRREASKNVTFNLPNSEDIKQTIEKARTSAIILLKNVGIPESKQRFESSLDINQCLIDFEFVSVGQEMEAEIPGCK